MSGSTGFSDAAMIIGATAIRGAIGALQAHTDTPGVGGAANKSSAAMVVPVFTAPSGPGNFDLAAPVEFTGGTPNGPIKWISAWSTAGGSGIWYGNWQLTGDLTFDGSGNYILTELAQTGSAS